MELVAAALVTGVLTLLGVLVSNSRSRAVMEQKIDALTKQVEKHNCLIERTFNLERDMVVARNDIDALKKRGQVMERFLASDEWYWRLARTVVQGVLGVVVANVDMLVGCAVLESTWRAVVVALVMAVLSFVMAELGAALPESAEEAADE